jgi:hypothetical protein
MRVSGAMPAIPIGSLRWVIAISISPLLVACHGRAAQPSATAQATPRAAVANPSATPAQASARAALLGDWCMQAQSVSATGERIPDGSKWSFHEDGSYDYARKWSHSSGTWTRGATTLEMSNIGAHEVVSWSPDKMVLKRSVYQFFGRDCGPEYAKAQLVEQLVAAAADGAEAKVDALLKAGADINGIDYLGIVEQTALIAAARDNRIGLVELLLRRGARPDVETHALETAMTTAERLGRSEIMAALIKAGARPHFRVLPSNAHAGENTPADGKAKGGTLAAALTGMDPGALSMPASATTPTAELPKNASSTKQQGAAAPATPSTSPAAPSQGSSPPLDLATLKQAMCEGRKESIEKVARGELDEVISALGVSRKEYTEKQQALYDTECR